MRLNDDLILRLAERTFRHLINQQLATAKAPEPEIIQRISEAIKGFQDKVDLIEEETRKLMDQYSSQMNAGQLDNQEMRQMIRKQVAKKFKFQLDTEDQVNWIAHQIHDGIYNDDLVDYSSEEKALLAIKQVVNATVNIEDSLDDKIRLKIGSLQRNVPEGSPEWDVLYRKYMDEELNKRV